jgi:uncharacterized membrane protein YqhA
MLDLLNIIYLLFVAVLVGMFLFCGIYCIFVGVMALLRIDWQKGKERKKYGGRKKK